jgi:hypothetical protein
MQCMYLTWHEALEAIQSLVKLRVALTYCFENFIDLKEDIGESQR